MYFCNNVAIITTNQIMDTVFPFHLSQAWMFWPYLTKFIQWISNNEEKTLYIPGTIYCSVFPQTEPKKTQTRWHSRVHCDCNIWTKITHSLQGYEAWNFCL